MRACFTLLLFLIISIGCQNLFGQKVILVEKAGRPKSQKLYINSIVTFKLKGDDVYYTYAIEDILVDAQAIVFPKRIVQLDQIESFRRPRNGMKVLGISLITFGAGWSTFAAIGTATDGNPDTKYETSDAIVSAVTVGSGFLFASLFKWKTTKFGKRKRLRAVDLTIY